MLSPQKIYDVNTMASNLARYLDKCEISDIDISKSLAILNQV